MIITYLPPKRLSQELKPNPFTQHHYKIDEKKTVYLPLFLPFRFAYLAHLGQSPFLR